MITNVQQKVLDNKQKITKITYDSGTSVTAIADTLKVSSIIIVGSYNYNSVDEFEKLQNITENTNLLTFNDDVILYGIYKCV